jgi:hypothetical protein
MLLELLDHAIEIGIVITVVNQFPAALGSPLAVSDFIRWLMKTDVGDVEKELVRSDGLVREYRGEERCFASEAS